MSEKQQAVYPVFGALAGTPGGGDGLLFYNSFGKWPQRRQRREIADIITHLTSPGRIPPDGVAIGWPGSGLKPVNAVDIQLTRSSWGRGSRGRSPFLLRVGPSGEATDDPGRPSQSTRVGSMFQHTKGRHPWRRSRSSPASQPRLITSRRFDALPGGLFLPNGWKG